MADLVVTLPQISKIFNIPVSKLKQWQFSGVFNSTTQYADNFCFRDIIPLKLYLWLTKSMHPSIVIGMILPHLQKNYDLEKLHIIKVGNNIIPIMTDTVAQVGMTAQVPRKENDDLKTFDTSNLSIPHFHIQFMKQFEKLAPIWTSPGDQ